MKKIIFLTIALGMSALVFAQSTGSVMGRVKDSATLETIPGANVVVKNSNHCIFAVTDVNGNFILKSLLPGTYDIEVSFTGYKRALLTGVKVSPEQITRTGDVILASGNMLFYEVKEFRDPIIPLNPVVTLRAEQISNIAGNKDIAGLIKAITPDLMKTDDGQLYFRGARNNDFVYYIDGVKVNGTDISIPTMAIACIQVYTGGVPARYGDFTGGCIVIETMGYFDWLYAQNK